MLKTKKVLIALLLAIVMVFGIAGCNAGTNELQGKIDDLQSQIDELEDRLAETEDQLREQDEKIEQLENELAEQSIGTFYSLQEAYDNGWLTSDNLKSIAFYYNELHYAGEVDYGEGFIPLIKNPAALDELIKEKIISAYCKKLGIEEFHDDVGISSYYGTYGDCIVIDIASGCTTGGGDPIYYSEYELGGIMFYNYSVIGVYRKIFKIF